MRKLTSALRSDTRELNRLQVLESYAILDNKKEAIFDEVAQMAASLCDTPIALVSFVDGSRQWFKARVGIELEETPRDIAFCAHAIEVREPFVVNNAATDPRFDSNPLVIAEEGIRFYAGAPLITAEGHALGTLCVIDRVPRELSADRLEGLKLLSQRLMAHLELRKKYAELMRENQKKIAALESSHAQLDVLVRSQRAQIEQLAQYNSHSGLPNRELFLERLEQHLDSALLAQTRVTVLVVDIQRFALVSESMGQSLLDSLLRQVGQRLAKVVGSAGALAHVDSDRFAALTMQFATCDEAASHFQDVVLPNLSAPYRIDDEEFRIAFRCGISISPLDGIAGERLLKQAKAALARAREQQETCVTFTADLETRVSQIVTFETKLRRAIEHEEFELHYQPKVSLLDGKVVGAEALLRWPDRDPVLGEDELAGQWIPPQSSFPRWRRPGLFYRWVSGHWPRLSRISATGTTEVS